MPFRVAMVGRTKFLVRAVCVVLGRRGDVCIEVIIVPVIVRSA